MCPFMVIKTHFMDRTVTGKVGGPNLPGVAWVYLGARPYTQRITRFMKDIGNRHIID